MTGVRIRMDARGESDALPASMQPMLEEVLSLQGAGLVSRIRIEDLRFESLRDGSPYFTLVAGRASVELGHDLVRLGGRLVLETAGGDKIEAPAAGWDPRRKTFRFDGPYLLTRGDHREAGQGDVFSVDIDGTLRRR